MALEPNLRWLIKNKNYIRITTLEKKAKLPPGTLKKFVNGERPLPENWHAKVIERIKKLRE